MASFLRVIKNIAGNSSKLRQRRKTTTMVRLNNALDQSYFKIEWNNKSGTKRLRHSRGLETYHGEAVCLGFGASGSSATATSRFRNRCCDFRGCCEFFKPQKGEGLEPAWMNGSESLDPMSIYLLSTCIAYVLFVCKYLMYITYLLWLWVIADWPMVRST